MLKPNLFYYSLVIFTAIGIFSPAKAATLFDCNGDGQPDANVDQCMLSDLFATPNSSITVEDKKFFMFTVQRDDWGANRAKVQASTFMGNPGLMFMVKNPLDRFNNVLYFTYMAQVTNNTELISDVAGFRNNTGGSVEVRNSDGNSILVLPPPPGAKADITPTRKLTLDVRVDGVPEDGPNRFDITLSQCPIQRGDRLLSFNNYAPFSDEKGQRMYARRNIRGMAQALLSNKNG